MRILKRIAAVAVMVVSVLVLVLGLAGIAGTWMVRSRLDDGLGRIVAAAGAEAAGARQELDRLDAALTQASTQIAAVEQEAQALGTDLDQNRPLLTTLTDKLGVDLAPLAARAREMMDTIRETVAAVNSIVETINALPFVSKPIPELEKPPASVAAWTGRRPRCWATANGWAHYKRICPPSGRRSGNG
jgi:hypothetical protein